MRKVNKTFNACDSDVVASFIIINKIAKKKHVHLKRKSSKQICI